MNVDPPVRVREEAPVYFFFRQSFLAFMAGFVPIELSIFEPGIFFCFATVVVAFAHLALIFVCSIAGVILTLYPPLDRAWRRNGWIAPTIGGLAFVGLCMCLGWGWNQTQLPHWIDDHLFLIGVICWVLTVFGILHTSFPWLLLPREKSDRV